MGVALSLALNFLKKNWKLVAVLAIVAASYFYMQHLYNTIDSQAHKITELTVANQILKENNDKLEAAIEANNQAIEKIAQGAAATNKAFSTLNNSVRAQTGSLEERLRRILAEKKPQTCDETILYLIQAAKEFKQ